MDRRTRWRRIVVVAAVVAAAAFVKGVLLRPAPVPVTVFRVARGRVEETVTNSRAGTVKARRRATLSPEVGGRVEELAIREGDRVRAGQVLMRIADADVKAQRELAERSLEVARAQETEACRQAEQARRDVARSEALARDEIVSATLLEQAQTAHDVTSAACETARARVAQARAQLELSGVGVAKSVLRAPFGGVVAKVSTEVGEWITPSPPGLPIPPVVDLFDPDALYVTAPIDEVDVGKVRTGVPVRVTLDAYPGQVTQGRVSRVAPYVADVREQNRTLDIEVELLDRTFARRLLPGTSADVVVVLDARDGVLRVPSYALLEGGKALVLDRGILVERRVEVGVRNWEYAEVKSGLAEGDAVVVTLDRAEVKAGARAVAEGETVR